MKRLVFALAALGFTSHSSALPLTRQTPVIVGDEITSDDDEPFAIGEIEIHHKRAVVVTTADLDEDGIVDVVIGGVDPNVSPDQFSVRVHYLNRWGIRHTEVLGDLNGNGIIDPSVEEDKASACYALSIEDVDGDQHKDIVVGRNTDSETNTVFLRRLIAVNGNFYNDASKIKPVPRPDGINKTTGVALFDADNDLDADLVTVGEYGVRFYIGRGDGEFQLADMMLYSIGGLRGVEEGDVNSDMLVDFVCVGGLQPRVFLNSAVGTDEKNRFNMTSQVLAEPPMSPLNSGQLVDDPRDPFMTNCNGGLTPFGVASVGTFHLALVDLDNDQDLDLVTANAYSRNCAYVNRGDGFFGDTTNPGNSFIAHQFAEIVPDWTGMSDALDQLYENATGTQLPFGCVGEYTIAGARLRMSTGVSTADVNLDGWKDIAFSNRADTYENMEFEIPGSTAGLPPVYDHLFLNKSTTANLSFPAIELLGDANDNTTYGILAHINLPFLGNPAYIGQDTDRRIDWLDVNFTRNDPDGDGVWSNDIYFGHRLVPQDYPVTASGSTVPFALHLATSRANGQGQWHLLASYAGPANPPVIWNGGPDPVAVPLQQDCLFAYSVDAGKKAGTIPNNGMVQIQGSYSPLGCTHSGAIYFCVAIFKGGNAQVTNVIRVPIQ